MINFADAVYVKEPFPHMVFQEFFEKDCLEGLSRHFPDSDVILKCPNFLGGRRTLSNSDPLFHSFMNSCTDWHDFYGYMNSPASYSHLLKYFEDDISLFGPDLDFQSLDYAKEHFSEIARKYGRYFEISSKNICNASSREMLWSVYKRQKIGLFKKLDQVRKKFVKNNRVAFYMDISAAREGYSREVHRDSDGRIMAMVAYLDDYENAAGGEFVIHRHKNSGELAMSLLPPQPGDDEVEEVCRYTPRRNFGIIFLSTPNSYHSVPRISFSPGWRKFFYASYTALDARAWKNRYVFN